LGYGGLGRTRRLCVVTPRALDEPLGLWVLTRATVGRAQAQTAWRGLAEPAPRPSQRFGTSTGLACGLLLWLICGSMRRAGLPQRACQVNISIFLLKIMLFV
jgi:hypothetical protein